MCAHFGSAPAFLIVDADGRSTELVTAPERGEHGGCRHLDLLARHAFDAMVVGGIGRGAIARFTGMGKKVYLAAARTVQENLVLLAQGQLAECDPDGHCEHPGHGHGHAHGIGMGGCGGHGQGFGAGRGQGRGGVMGHGGCGGRGGRGRG